MLHKMLVVVVVEERRMLFPGNEGKLCTEIKLQLCTRRTFGLVTAV